MSGIRRIREHVRPGDFLDSCLEFLLAAGFLVFAAGLHAGLESFQQWVGDLPNWIFCELGVAFLLGLAHFVGHDDPRMPLWSRIAFAATLGLYVAVVLRQTWMIAVPLLVAKVISLWMHGTLTEEEFGYRLLKGFYVFGFAVLGSLAWTVFDAIAIAPASGWPLALLVGLYYLGLGLWQVVLSALKRANPA